jgi:methionyl-tRNA formyltransferase
VFLGTPEFAVPTLEALIAAGHEIAAVYTQPPRPAGRGQKPRPSPVEAVARRHGIEVRSPERIRTPEAVAAFAGLHTDAGVVVAYGRILPDGFLTAPRLGCINLHASLLPRWRGAAPIQRAIMAGDAETGATAMLVTPELDTGDILLQQRLPIGETTTAGELHERLAEIGAPLICRALAGLADGSIRPLPQAEDGITYADKIDKAEARIDWSRPAAVLARLVNGLSPFPGAWFEHEGQRIKVLLARAVAGGGGPGEVVGEHGLSVACGEGRLELLRLQRAGKAALDAGAFRRGLALAPGSRLG